MTALALTDSATLDRFLSAQGALAITDNDGNGVEDAGVRDDSISYASAMFAGRVSQRYEASVLNRSPMVRELVTVMAARTGFTRRGNPIPDSLEMRYQEIVAEPNGLLAQIANGIIKLLDASGVIIGGRPGAAPTMSNMTIDRRYVVKTVRVREATSTRNASQLPRNVAATTGWYDG